MFHKLWTRFCGLNANATVEGGNGGACPSALPHVLILSCDVDELSSPSVVPRTLELTAGPSAPLAVSERRNLPALPGVLGLMTMPDDE